MNSRFTSVALIGAALIALVLAGCDSAELTGVTADGRGNDGPKGEGNISIDSRFDADASDGVVDLVGGKNTKVGTVSWEEAGGGVLVTYSTLPGYCITEWHLGAGTVDGEGDLTGIAVNGGGNPQVGQFDFKGENVGCLTTVEQFVPDANFEGEGDRVLAAHAVVQDNPEGCNFFYGIASDGNIYQISLGDLMTPGDETETLFFATGLEFDAVAETWPNSLAYDGVTDRLYYSNATAFGPPTGEGVPDPTSPLFFYDFATDTGNTHAGNLSRRSASGTFTDGDFWYVPQNLDDNLRRVSFNGDGTVDTDALACGDFTGAGGLTPLFFGDIAYDADDGLIYGSVRFQAAGTDDPISTFFSLDPTSCAYTPINPETVLSQLTIDCDGNLIGFNTRAGIYYYVDRATGAQTVIGTSDLAINDLAPGQCECPGDFNETAWGVGDRFRDRGGSWAMYIVID